jgi:hypothetical protein
MCILVTAPLHGRLFMGKNHVTPLGFFMTMVVTMIGYGGKFGRIIKRKNWMPCQVFGENLETVF